MGWGLNIKNVYLSRVKIDDIEETINEYEGIIERSKEMLIAFAASTPRDIKDDAGYTMQWEEHILQNIGLLVDDIADAAGTLSKLYEAQENPENCTEG